MLGRPEYIASLDKPSLKPHLIKMQDWVSAFSYVLKPDIFLSLCEYIGKQDRDVCRAVFTALFNRLRSSEVYSKKEVQHCTTTEVNTNQTQKKNLTIFTFSHGNHDEVYGPGYANTIVAARDLVSADGIVHEFYIDKTHDAFRPESVKLSRQFDQARNILHPVFSQSTPITFKA